MAAFYILRRSQSSLFNSPKFNLILHSLLNPNFSRHFHSNDSITPKSSPESPSNGINGVSEYNPSPEEPISEPSPRVCSSKPVTSDGNVIKTSWLPDQNEPFSLDDVNPEINHSEQRIRLPGLFGAEFNTVLGGGVVRGSMTIVGGDPGVGKSTLALQMAALIAESSDVGGAGPVSYICGEESVEQIRKRAVRLSINTKGLLLYSSTDVEDVLEKMQLLSPPCAVVVDSIQTMYLKGVTGSCGGLAQLKACTLALLRFAKKTRTPVILGERHSSRRFLCSVKNRFGSTDELGVFEMSNSGLKAVSNPSEMFLREEDSDSEYLIGHAIAVIFREPRTLLVKVQALCVPEFGASAGVNGVKLSRACFIVSVLRRQARLKIDYHSISLNIINGVFLKENSGDLAVAAAICSRQVITSCQLIPF